MKDDLTRAIAEALGCDVTMDDEGGYYCSEHGEYLDHTGQCLEADRIAAALTPLIEARVREARADALEWAADQPPATDPTPTVCGREDVAWWYAYIARDHAMTRARIRRKAEEVRNA